MDISCTTGLNTASTDNTSTTTPPPSTAKSPPHFHHVGSGTSVIVDQEIGIEAQSRKLPSSKFKGVVPQPNGRWGAQIYEKHQRVWLGTFNEETEAARAYDTAARRFRGGDAVTNLKETEENSVEIQFLNSHSKAEIVDMLRKHTYDDELEQSRRKFINGPKTGQGFIPFSLFPTPNTAREQLFEKIVTPSDVGKLNRLVIPKQHAEKHFPSQKGNCKLNLKGILLSFEEMGGRVWRFRYSYWNSSQSYVLTKGWSRFVKEKNLRAGDVVSFQLSTGPDKQFYIDCKTRNCCGLAEILDRPVQPVRLFGVNIWSEKRIREMKIFGSDQLNKKQRVIGAL